jgi:hypothetical protein
VKAGPTPWSPENSLRQMTLAFQNSANRFQRHYVSFRRLFQIRSPEEFPVSDGSPSWSQRGVRCLRGGERIMANVEDESIRLRIAFLTSLSRFTDMTLKRLDEASQSEDVDEKETRMLCITVLKTLNIWERALHSYQQPSRLENCPNPKKPA